MNRESLRLIALSLVLAAVMPLRADGESCFAPATSFASTARNPTNGDEKFFTLPAGPANVMFILDSSGSMLAIPQCGDMRGTWWGSWQPIPGMTACTYPTLAAFSGNSAQTVGTCDVASNPELAWMRNVVLQTAYADPGHGTANSLGLDDQPTWGTNCNGNDCLFNPDGYYIHGQWNESSATQFEDCTAYSEPGRNPPAIILDRNNNKVTADVTACRSCLSTAGFYFFRTRYQDGSGNWVDTPTQVRFSGKWLNANPPKVVAARKVIKDLIWMDAATPRNSDKVRFGLSKLGGEILVPLGPDKGDSYVIPPPTPQSNFVEARQLMLDVLNRRTSPAIDLASGSTPLATTLFNVGQYFTSSGKYTEWFPSGTYEFTNFEESVAGTANAPWARGNADQCSVCWGCQQNSIILVTDGSPNSEDPLPSELDAYDDATYKRADNCGPGDCSGAGTCSDVFATDVLGTRYTGAASAVGTVSASMNTVDCNASNTLCRCRTGEGTRVARNTVACYTCPGSTRLHFPSFTCTYYSCDGGTTKTATNVACYGLCSGDPTHRPVGDRCGCFCGTDLLNSYASGTTCPASMCCSPSDTSTLTLLPRVASWLHNHDLRDDLSLKDPQVVSTYTVSFGLLEPASPAVNPAVQILKATAAMGGGFFSNASDRSTLATAMAAAVADVADQATSFGAPAAASLSTLRTVAVEAVLTRFLPNSTPMWEGHVFQGQLFDEFLNGCDPNKTAAQQPRVTCAAKSLSADMNGDGKCTGVFLLDADCDEVEEDSTGVFYKKGVANTSGTCSTTTTTTCSTATSPTGCPTGETCVARGGVLANMFWDAGLALSSPTYPTGHPRAGQAVPGYKGADDRTILSVVGTTVTPFDRAHAADWVPYLNLDNAWCAAKLQTWGICGSTPLPDCSTFTGGVRQRCAQAIIDFVHGWDVTDNDGDRCGGPGAHDNATACASGADGEERNRQNDGRTGPSFWKLGDTFHSSPVLVRGPPDTFRCNTGLENQCTPTIYSPATFAQQTSMATGYTALDGTATANAYEAFRLAQRNRQQVVLVGANDGMLHAFDAGSADTTATADANGVFPFSRGTGTELWAFIPPDLLPRLKDLTVAHQYMVDGGIMVKDVWVDGSTSDPSDFDNSNPIDTVKQYQVGKEEFHTVAVITERTGGTQYTGLDITDVTSPKFLWTFPPPGSDDARYMAQSWSDFSPGPPPIGPFRFGMRSGVTDPTGRRFEERWAVTVNGGYDPTLARGRAVWLVDVWTGSVLWRFTDDDFKANMSYGSGTSMFPVVGSVSGADIGDWNLSTPDNDGFYDTLTWADMGGSLFVARVWTPGTLDAGGKVTDWYAARAFEQQRQVGNDTQPVAGRTPFFYMPDVVFDSTTKTLRAFLGSGNRERIMATTSECNPDNLLGCCQAGCTAVTATVTDTFGTCTQTASFSCTSGALTLPATTTSCAASPPACGVGFSGTATLHLECPSQPAIDITSSTTCTSNGTSYECTTPSGLGTNAAGNLDPLTTKARFYGIWAFGGTTAKSFNTLAESQAFEANRYTDVTYSGCTGPASGACGLIDVTSATVTYDATSPSITTASVQATGADAGWFYQYGTSCPLASCSESAWVDEKTGAGASVMVGCVSWGGFRPTTTSNGNDPCTDRPLPQAFSYLADYVSGTPSATCGYQNAANTRYIRATQRSTFATPAVQTVRVVLSPTGEVKYQGLEFPPGGSGGMVSETTYGTRSDVAETMYWLEVPRDLHNCRHVAALSASVCE